jgi:uncharacterized protein
MLKPSRFNLFIPYVEEGQFLLYNTLTGSVFVVNEKAKKALENFKHNLSLDEAIFNKLQKEGILVSDAVDELAMFKVHRDRVKYGGNKLSLAILTTYNCNLKCIYCCSRLLWSARNQKVPNTSMNDEVIELVLAFIMKTVAEKNYSEIVIDFVGLGEPLSRPEIIIRILKGLSPFVSKKNIALKINILSNGTLMSKSMLRILRNYNVRMQITLDGPENIHNARRMYKNGKGTYSNIIENLKLLKVVGIKFAIRVNVDNTTFEYIDDLLEALKTELGEGLFIRFSPLLPGKDRNCGWSKYCFDAEGIAKISDLWERAHQKGFYVLLGPLINFLSCKAMSDHCYVVDPVGDVYKCEGFGGNKEFRIGTLNKDGIIDELAFPYFKWMSLDPLDIDECRNCLLLPTCGGECPELQYYYHGKCDLGICTKSKEYLISNISFQLRKFYLKSSGTSNLLAEEGA